MKLRTTFTILAFLLFGTLVYPAATAAPVAATSATPDVSTVRTTPLSATASESLVEPEVNSCEAGSAQDKDELWDIDSVSAPGQGSCGHGVQACRADQVGQPCDPNNLNVLCSRQSNGHYCCLAYAPRVVSAATTPIVPSVRPCSTNADCPPGLCCTSSGFCGHRSVCGP